MSLHDAGDPNIGQITLEGANAIELQHNRPRVTKKGPMLACDSAGAAGSSIGIGNLFIHRKGVRALVLLSWG